MTPHESLQRSRHEAVVDEEIFLYAELFVPALEIADAVVELSMAQNQILGSGRRSSAPSSVVGAKRVRATA